MSLETTMDRINKKYGKGTLVRAHEAVGLRIRRFSTGSYSLDLALAGGFPRGRLIEIIGNFSSYKSTLTIIAAAAYIRSHADNYVIYVDPEGTFDPKWMRYLGADPERFLICQPASGEDAGNIVCDALREGDPVMYIIDSIAALMPQVELEGKQDDLRKGQPGTHARLMSKMFRKMTALIRKDLTSDKPRATVVCLNQIRMKIGLLFGNPETGTGGRAKDFYVSQQIIMKREDFILDKGSGYEDDDDEERDKDGKLKDVVGAHVKFSVVKNKCGGAQSEVGRITFYNRDTGDHRGGTIDNANDIIPYAIHHGIITRKKNAVRWGKKSFRSRDVFASWLRRNPSRCREIYERILTIIGGRHQRDEKKSKVRW